MEGQSVLAATLVLSRGTGAITYSLALMLRAHPSFLTTHLIASEPDGYSRLLEDAG